MPLTMLASQVAPTGVWTESRPGQWRRDLPDGRVLSADEDKNAPGHWSGCITAHGTRGRVFTDRDADDLSSVQAALDALAGTTQPRTCHRCYTKERAGVRIAGRDPTAICETCLHALLADVAAAKERP